jgi:CheY-like chemotaxis protein
MIVDIFMPKMRGFESIRAFHNHAPTVPLIAIAGSASSGPELKCLSEAKPHRRHVATLNAVTNARSEPQRRLKSSDRTKDEALAGRTIRFQSKARSVVLGRAAQKDVA